MLHSLTLRLITSVVLSGLVQHVESFYSRFILEVKGVLMFCQVWISMLEVFTFRLILEVKGSV